MKILKTALFVSVGLLVACAEKSSERDEMTDRFLSPWHSLTTDEVAQVTTAVTESVDAQVVFNRISLLEPHKQDALSWDEQSVAARGADVLYRSAKSSYRVQYDFQTGALSDPQRILSGQPMLVQAELINALDAVNALPEVRAALERRGVSARNGLCMPRTVGRFFSSLAKLTNLMKHIPRQMVKRLLASTMVQFGALDLEFLRNWVASICSERDYDTTHLHPTVNREKIDFRELESETEPNSDMKEEEESEEVIHVPVASKLGTSWDDLKGMESFVNWAKGKGRLFTPEAKEFGFTRYPTGVILTGVPGCGKTMAAKIISHEWSMNFKRVTIDMVTSKFVGGNEEKMQELLEELEEMAPVVCFVDEAEKLFAQVRTGDLYQSSDAARDATESLLLQFMEENESGVFFVFTSNDIDKLSPALVDRFDERFFIDLPSNKARKEMIQSMLEERKKRANEYDLSSLAKASEGFTGRDIRSAIEEAMMNAFMENRELSTQDLLNVFQNLTPTSVTANTQIDKMRQLVLDGKVRSANTHEGKLRPPSTFDPSVG